MMQGKLAVLVVDDDESARDLLQQALEGAGYGVVTAAGGREALDKASRQEFALALLDVNMPGMSGMEVLRRLRAEHPATAALMVTGVVETQTAVEAMKLGAYDYITKPFALSDAVVKVEKALSRRGQELQDKQYRRYLEEKVAQQTGRLQEQFTELIRSLAREHQLLYGLEEARRSKRDKGVISSLPPELQKPMSTVEEFRDALLRILKKAQL